MQREKLGDSRRQGYLHTSSCGAATNLLSAQGPVRAALRQEEFAGGSAPAMLW